MIQYAVSILFRNYPNLVEVKVLAQTIACDFLSAG